MFVIGNMNVNRTYNEETMNSGLAKGPIDVSIGELEKFKTLNPDYSKVSCYADKIKNENEEYQVLSFRQEVIVILFLKEKHFNNINDYVKVGTSFMKYYGLITTDPNSIYSRFLCALNNNSKQISKYIMDFYEPDLRLIDNEERKIMESSSEKIVIGERNRSLSLILTDFGLPSDISRNLQEIYNDGLSPGVIKNLSIALINFFIENKFLRESKSVKLQENEDQMPLDDSDFDNEDE